MSGFAAPHQRKYLVPETDVEKIVCMNGFAAHRRRLYLMYETDVEKTVCMTGFAAPCRRRCLMHDFDAEKTGGLVGVLKDMDASLAPGSLACVCSKAIPSQYCSLMCTADRHHVRRISTPCSTILFPDITNSEAAYYWPPASQAACYSARNLIL